MIHTYKFKINNIYFLYFILSNKIMHNYKYTNILNIIKYNMYII